MNDGTHRYQWDAEGHLKSVDSGATACYAYNALGQRVVSTVSGATIDAVYDPFGNLMAYLNTSTVFEDFFPPLAGRQFAKYQDNLTYFLHPNALGTTSIVTNQTGGMTQDLLYYPWGQVWTVAGAEKDVRFAKLGERDPESDLDPTPNRMYESRIGRWLTPDPFIPMNLEAHEFQAWISDPQHWNKYAYARNNPTTLTDPLGLTETIYYWVDKGFTDEQRKFFQQHKAEILSAIANRLKEAGIKDVVFKEGSSLTKSQIKDVLEKQPKGVAFLNFANESYGGKNAPSELLGATEGMRSVVFVGHLSSWFDAIFSLRISQVAEHELGHGMGFETIYDFWSRDLMKENQNPTDSWYWPLSWGARHFDMSIPQNRQAVDEINKLPEYEPN